MRACDPINPAVVVPHTRSTDSRKIRCYHIIYITNSFKKERLPHNGCKHNAEKMLKTRCMERRDVWREYVRSISQSDTSMLRILRTAVTLSRLHVIARNSLTRSVEGCADCSTEEIVRRGSKSNPSSSIDQPYHCLLDPNGKANKLYCSGEANKHPMTTPKTLSPRPH